MNKEIIKMAILYAVLLFAVYKLLQKIGLVETATEKKEREDRESGLGTGTDAGDIGKSPFDFVTWGKANPMTKANQTIYLRGKGITPAVLDQLAKALFEAKGINNLSVKNFPALWRWLDDNEDGVYSVFRKIKSQRIVAILSSYFTAKYNRDLILHLDGFMTDAELNNVIGIVMRKPLN